MIVTEQIFSYGKTVMLDGVPVFDYYFNSNRVHCVGRDNTKYIAVFKLKNYEKI